MLTGTDILTIERALQLAIAPAFVLGGVMAVMNLLIGRLHRIHDRMREYQMGTTAELAAQALLDRRARIIYAATAACILASVLLCLLVIVSFIEPIFGVRAGTHVAALLVAAMFSVAIALGLFLRELTLSARGIRLGSP